MPNDAKLGLVIGVGLVIAVAVVFFRKDLVTAKPPAEAAAAVVVNPPSPPAHDFQRTFRPVSARTAERSENEPATMHHTVKEGETLFSLAQRYYGDKEKFEEIYRVNREVVPAPDQLTPGTVLVIPDLEASPAPQSEDNDP